MPETIPQHIKATHSRNGSEATEISRFSSDSDIRPNINSTSTLNNPPPRRFNFFSKLKMSKLMKSLLFWRKKDKSKKLVLPVSIEAEEKKKKKEKRRKCCQWILIIIFIWLLLGNIIALDVVYFRSPALQTNNITTLLNNNTSDNSPNSPNLPNAPNVPALQDQNIKAVTCITLLSSMPPKDFNCAYCADQDAFYNVTSFCALRSIWANAINITAVEELRWMSNINYCSWGGVTCDGSFNITELDLSGPLASTTFDSSLGELQTLRKLNIEGNGAFPNGKLPIQLFQNENLEDFSVIFTNLTGPLPNTFDRMTSLKTLKFINNFQWNYPVPDSISLTSIETLVFSGSNINGAIPDFIGNSKSLQASLTTLDLSFNQYSGIIPDSLLNLPNLISLNLNNNLLTGEPFPRITTAKFANSLVSLTIATNGFTGILTPSVSQFVNLVDINIQQNSFTGPIPSELASLKKLTSIILLTNRLTGSIPDTIGTMTLYKLLLFNNTLTGNIPNNICTNDIQFCNLRQNEFTNPPVTCGNCVFDP